MDIFGEKLLQMKKAVFFNAVENAASALGVKTPKVKFWDGICPHDDGNSIAHIHLDTKTICIARRYLVALNFDELKDTAAHEVAHLKEANHSANFGRHQENAKLISWTPPIAYSGIKSSNRTKPNKKKKKK